MNTAGIIYEMYYTEHIYKLFHSERFLSQNTVLLIEHNNGFKGEDRSFLHQSALSYIQKPNLTFISLIQIVHMF